jgi:hypothetical protein
MVSFADIDDDDDTPVPATTERHWGRRKSSQRSQSESESLAELRDENGWIASNQSGTFVFRTMVVVPRQ